MWREQESFWPQKRKLLQSENCSFHIHEIQPTTAIQNCEWSQIKENTFTHTHTQGNNNKIYRGPHFVGSIS